MTKKERIVRYLISGALVLWLGVRYQFLHPGLWVAFVLVLAPALDSGKE